MDIHQINIVLLADEDSLISSFHYQKKVTVFDSETGQPREVDNPISLNDHVAQVIEKDTNDKVFRVIADKEANQVRLRKLEALSSELEAIKNNP